MPDKKPTKTVVLSHDEVLAAHNAYQAKVTATMGHYHVTMEVVKGEEDYDEETFAATFNVEHYIADTLFQLSEEEMSEEERSEVYLTICRSWSLVSLTTKVAIPEYLVVLDDYVMAAYRHLVKSYSALNNVTSLLANDPEAGKELLAKAEKNLAEGKALSLK